MYITSDFSFHDIEKLVKENMEFISGKFLYDKNISKCSVVNWTISYLQRLIDREGIIRLALVDEKNLVQGALFLEKSDWDSEHFGFGVGKYKFLLFKQELNADERISLIKEAVKEAANIDLKVLFARVPLYDMMTIHAHEREGSILTDILLTYYINLKQQPVHKIKAPDIQITVAEGDDESDICNIARDVFRIDHFHADPRLNNNKCDELYGKWALNSLRGLVDEVLVAKKNSEILGFVTCKIERLDADSTYGFIDLIGVSDKYQRKGIGGILISEALEWFSTHASSAYVGTQTRNLAAMRLYERMNFIPVFCEATLHHWIY